MSISKFISKLKEKISEKAEERSLLTGEMAWNITRFDTVDIDQVVRNKIWDIREWIKYKAKIKGETDVIISIPDNQTDIYNQVVEHFETNGFTIEYVDLKKIKGKHVVISWNRLNS